MTRIARHALLPSLLASALVGPAVAETTPRIVETAGTQTQTPGPASQTPTRCPSCDRSGSTTATPARELLGEEKAITATRNAVRSLLGADLEDAEEAAQEAALRAVTKELQACCPRGLQRWLFRTAKNYLLDRHRKKREVLLSTMTEPRSNGETPLPLPANSDVGPLQILALRDEVETAFTRHDLRTLSADKKVQLGRALGDRLQSGKTVRRYLPKAAVLVDEARAAVHELTPRS